MWSRVLLPFVALAVGVHAQDILKSSTMSEGTAGLPSLPVSSDLLPTGSKASTDAGAPALEPPTEGSNSTIAESLRPSPTNATDVPTTELLTVMPTPTPAPTPSSSPARTLAPTQAPTPTPSPTLAPTPIPNTPAPTKYTPPPIPVATADSTTFQLVDNVICPDDVVDTIYTIYTKNRALFDTCAQRSAYQIFPFSGEPPTQSQIVAMATTEACTVLFTACVVAKLPECDSSGISLKAVTESLLKVSEDVRNNKPAPDSERFHAMHVWRRDSNLAKSVGVPYGKDSALYAEYERDVAAALAKYSVQVHADLTIQVNAKADPSEETRSPETPSHVLGDVHSNDAVASNATPASEENARDADESGGTFIKVMSGANSIGYSAVVAVVLSVVGSVLL